MFGFVGVVGNDAVCDDDMFTPQRPSDVFRFLLSKGVLSEFKRVVSFFVKIAEKSELDSYPIERRLALLRFVHA